MPLLTEGETYLETPGPICVPLGKSHGITVSHFLSQNLECNFYTSTVTNPYDHLVGKLVLPWLDLAWSTSDDS